MILANYKQSLKTKGNSRCIGTQGQTISIPIPFMDFSVSSCTTNEALTHYSNTGTTLSMGSSIWNLVLGTGTKPVTKFDYQLDQFCDTLTFNNSIVACDSSLVNEFFGITENWSNNTNNTITITEVGMAASSGVSNSAVILFARKIFDTPIVFEPNSTHSICYMLDFSGLYI